MLNFTEEVRGLLISQGRTIRVYLHVSFKNCHQADGPGKRAASSTYQKQKQIDRETVLHDLQHSINKNLENMLLHAEQGKVCQSADGFPVHFHFALGSSIVDLPETKDILALRRGTNTPVPCHLCYIQKDQLSLCNVANRRTIIQINGY